MGEWPDKIECSMGLCKMLVVQEIDPRAVPNRP